MAMRCKQLFGMSCTKNIPDIESESEQVNKRKNPLRSIDDASLITALIIYTPQLFSKFLNFLS